MVTDTSWELVQTTCGEALSWLQEDPAMEEGEDDHPPYRLAYVFMRRPEPVAGTQNATEGERWGPFDTLNWWTISLDRGLEEGAPYPFSTFADPRPPADFEPWAREQVMAAIRDGKKLDTDLIEQLSGWGVVEKVTTYEPTADPDSALREVAAVAATT